MVYLKSPRGFDWVVKPPWVAHSDAPIAALKIPIWSDWNYCPGNCIRTPRTGISHCSLYYSLVGSYCGNVVFVVKLIISTTVAEIVIVVCRAPEAVNDGDLCEDVAA